jgi:hypothetical protein
VCSDCNPVLGELGDREAQLGARSPLKICTNDAPRVIGAVAHPKSSHESALGHANNPKAAPDGKKVQDGLADGPKFEELWWSEAFDPQGKSQAYGLGVTHTDARAHAWISVWWEGYDAREALYLVPPLVSEGWRFEIYPPGGPMFQLGGADAREVDPSSEH